MKNLSLPGNPRYQPKNIQDYFGYDNLYSAVGEVEFANLEVLGEIGVIPPADLAHLLPGIKDAFMAIPTTEVDEYERTVTKHDIRAWVEIAKAKVPEPLKRWIHVPLTSYDVLDTARILQFKRAHEGAVRPQTDKIIRHLIRRVRESAAVPQIGRTHGQHALPITVGFWLATILNRMVVSIDSANAASSNLVGKISGAVGAYNAQVGLGIAACCGDYSFEWRVLDKLGLKPAHISTQILPPEPLVDYLFACIKLSAVFGQFGRDCRHLMRTEIGELCEPFAQGQVGSSTMAHKRNPITFEGLESAWLKNKNEFGKVLDTMISDHQRDLVGSAISRDFPVIVVNLMTQLNTLLRESDGKSFIERISFNLDACERNIALQGGAIMAEPIYIALQMAGYEGNAHELVNHHAMPHAQAYRGMSLLEATREVLSRTQGKDASERIWSAIPPEVRQMLLKPERYIGGAASKALQVVATAEGYLDPVSALL